VKKINKGVIISDIKYGTDPSQMGDLYIPEGENKGIITLFHGGFWMMPYGLHQLDRLSRCLMAQGFVVWNIEYRRTGVPGRLWTDPFVDAVKSINYLEELSQLYKQINLERLILAGHSAGGHLALWSGHNRGGVIEEKLQVTPKHIIGMAPVVDLKGTYNTNIGKEAVLTFLQCTPEENPLRYDKCSPLELFPLKIPTTILHGHRDEYLPIESTRKFAEKNGLYDNTLSLIEIPEGKHMDFIDPESLSVEKMIGTVSSLF
jgi:acetyl esterase/lipase